MEHPSYYQGENGIETIEIIRHYTCDIANALKYLMRAGKKSEMGMEDAEKEIEDLKKALWYIEDYKAQEKELSRYGTIKAARGSGYTDKECAVYQVELLTGYTLGQIVKPYVDDVREAMSSLLLVGMINTDGRGGCYLPRTWRKLLDDAIRHIQYRILAIEHSLLDKEIKETIDVMNGQAIDGEDYVSKPGGVRETEPEKYDPLNMIVAWGRVYSLTDEVRKKPNGALYSPCDNCDLIEVCYDDWRHPDTSVCHDLCRLHQAKTNEYYREVGVAKYSPKFGTVEVVDEHKEMQLELKRMQEEEEK